ncbi:hypothetical protein PMIN01_09552 [Paraphaeosphaeria minitans]|uniref:Uncharacterized protein n=1 Tax=Paraphaeosphaeria minitans TaxID=565426 RepID=A0A9P6GEF5_9PLEO|nr:hypothetical protein PMIN01_09552 [Paraphaeosphaeria minitans]
MLHLQKTCKVQREDRSERDTLSAKEPVTFPALPNFGTENAADGRFRRCGSFDHMVAGSQPYPALISIITQPARATHAIGSTYLRSCSPSARPGSYGKASSTATLSLERFPPSR